MLTKQWLSEGWPLAVFTLSFGVAAIHISQAEETGTESFRFFREPEINYWNEPVTPKKVQPTQSKSEGATPQALKSVQSGFAWNKYLNPSNDEFFKEGDYTPPAPFMEITRNPTDSNIENWFKYLGMKNELMQRLQEKLTEYAAKKSQQNIPLPQPYGSALASDPSALSKMAAKVRYEPAPSLQVKDFRLRLYFDSHCPHCEHMMGTVRELMQLGYWVELKQTDKDVSARSRIPFAVTSASSEELKRYQIESVPVLLVGNLKSQSFFKIQGYQPTNEVIRVLKEKR